MDEIFEVEAHDSEVLCIEYSPAFDGKAYIITINSGVQVQVLLFGDCAFSWHRLCGVLIIMGYFSTRLNIILW